MRPGVRGPITPTSISFSAPPTVHTVLENRFPSIHRENVKGTSQQNRDHVLKDGEKYNKGPDGSYNYTDGSGPFTRPTADKFYIKSSGTVYLDELRVTTGSRSSTGVYTPSSTPTIPTRSLPKTSRSNDTSKKLESWMSRSTEQPLLPASMWLKRLRSIFSTPASFSCV